MKVQIEGDFYIESEDREFTLKEYTGTISKPTKGETKGKPVFKTHGYFSDVQGAAKKYLNLKVGSSQAKNLKELIADVDAIRAFIQKQIDF